MASWLVVQWEDISWMMSWLESQWEGCPLGDITVRQPMGGLSYPTVAELLRADDQRPTLLPGNPAGRKQEMKTTHRKSINCLFKQKVSRRD